MNPPTQGAPLSSRGGALLHAATLPHPEVYSGKIAEAARVFVEKVREQLEAAHDSGAGGEAVALSFSEAIDELLRFIFEATTVRFSRRYARGARQRCAIIAQGGYGRREMNPWSDVDYLIVYPGRVNAYVETINERMIQTLFDAQLQAGWAVRTLKDCVDQAATDVTIKTTLLDGRFVAGESELGSQFTETVQDVLAARDIDLFVSHKLDEQRSRHAAYGGSVFMLEPDIKEGLGGLRDLHTLVWIGRVLRGALTLSDLSPARIASPIEEAELSQAREFLMRVRNALHFLSRFKQDKLSFDAQETIAERLAYKASREHSAVDQFMRDYYSNAAIIARTSADLIVRMTAPPEPKGIITRLSSRELRDGVSVAGGQLVAEDRIFAEDPINLLAVFVDAQRNDVTLSSGTQDAVRRRVGLLNKKLTQSQAFVDLFMSILRAHDGVYRTLAEMNRLGVLGALIPEFGRLFCMVQHDFYHVYTVDEHSLVGIRELERVREGGYARESPMLTQAMRDCDKPELLFLGMMFHDLGKGYGGNHDEKGAIMVREIAQRLNLHLDDRRGLEFLVRYHLMMSTLAQTRDIEDVDLIAEFVKQVGTVENLRNLYLLTFADMKAVGPKIWNGWRDHLLSELYLRAIDVFETGAVTEANLEARVGRVRERLLDNAGGDAERERLGEFLAAMPAAYLLSSADERIIDHWRLYESLGQGLFRAGIAHFPRRGFSELTVCTPDQEGLFVRLAGVLSARGLNIVSAKIVTSEVSGIALDTFRVDHACTEADPLDPKVWSEVRADVEHVLADELDVDELVFQAERSRPAPASVRRARKRAITRVSIDNEISRDYSVIDVYAADRIGLLFRVGSAIYSLGLTIHLAKINTHVNQVLDVFYVTDAGGGKLEDEAAQAEIVEAVSGCIRDPDDAGAV